MANTTIELTAYSAAPDSALVFDRIYQLRVAGQPTTGTVEQAYFAISQDGCSKLQLSLGDGLTYDPVDKSVRVQITNERLAFVHDAVTLSYTFYIVLTGWPVQTVREGAVRAGRVA